MTSIWRQGGGNAESDGLVPLILETLAINQCLQLASDGYGWKSLK